ncbi:MAG: MFS transporter [Cyanobacteria bacterium P01_H01_bin.121]
MSSNYSRQPSNSAANQRQVLVSSIIGNVLEWYDYALYGYLAPIISELFFPSENALTSLINTFAVFALGSLSRPLGGLFLGHIGDRYGRQRLLILSAVLMALPTFLIGLLPTYASAGILAPILLCLLRLLQGLSTGGEFVGSITFLAEQAPSSRQGFYSSFANSGAMIGAGLGSIVIWVTTLLVPNEIMQAWGWRVPFLTGILLGLYGVWLRMRLSDSQIYLELQSNDQVEAQPVREAVRRHWRQIFLTFGLNWVVSVGYYVTFVWYVTDMTKIIGLSYHTSLGIGSFGLIVGLIATPVLGSLSDRWGRRTVLTGAAILTAIATLPLLILAGAGTVAAASGVQFGLALLVSAFLGVLPAVFVSLFSSSVRCSGLAIGYNLAPAIFGGTAPLVATLLVKFSGWPPAPGIYLILTAVIFMFLIRFIPENRQLA